MAVIALHRIEPVKTVSGNAERTLTLPLAASQTFVRGEPVYLVAGYVTEATASTVLLGFAAEDATSGTAGQYNVKVWIADTDTIFVGNKGATSLASNATADTYVTSVVDRGRQAALFNATATTAGVWTVDVTGTGTNSRLTIVDIDPRDTVGDSLGRLHFTVKSQFAQLQATS